MRHILRRRPNAADPNRHGTGVITVAASALLVALVGDARADVARSGSALSGQANPWSATSIQERGTWTRLVTSGTPSPAARRGPNAIYDPLGDRMIMVGGEVPDGDTWALDLATLNWSVIVGYTPSLALAHAVAVYDPVRHRMLLFGGSKQGQYLNDVWVLPLSGTSAWQRLAVAGDPPDGRMGAVGVYDPARDQVVVIGGYPGPKNDVAILSLAGTPTWTRPGVPGGFTARWGHTGVYDPIGDRVIVFGGSASEETSLLNDLWELNLGTLSWSPLEAGPRPPALLLGKSVYDPANRSMVLYGGFVDGSLGATWELTLRASPQWVEMAAVTPPTPPRRMHSAVYGETQGDMIVFGGYDDSGGFLNDTWALDLGPPVPLISSFTPKAGRIGDKVMIAGNTPIDDALSVKFNGIEASFAALDPWTLSATVPLGATTGPITVTTPRGMATTSEDFFVGEIPEVLAAEPDNGRLGAHITIHGNHLTGATRVSFGPSSSASFSVRNDSEIEAIVDGAATTGPISVTNPLGTGTSAFEFQRIPFNPSAHLLPVRDVPLDQGGRVVLRWERSDLDAYDVRVIEVYRVWRRAPAFALRSPSRTEPGHAVEADFWESVGEIPAIALDGYAFTAATLSDSTEAANPFTAFFVEAVESSRQFHLSNVDSGYSVDNLAPAAPTGFFAQFVEGGVRLHWQRNHEQDLESYRIYRGESPEFELDAASFVIDQPDTGYFDLRTWGINYYKLVAMDIHGNTSPVVAASADVATGALMSLASVAVKDGGVRIIWRVALLPGATWQIERKDPGADWRWLADVTPDRDGNLSFDDSGLRPGDRVGYRLRATIVGRGYVSSEVVVSVPPLGFAIGPVYPNPAPAAELVIDFTLSDDAPARLEIMDVSGRRVSSREVGMLGSGPHRATLPEGRTLSTGVYFARLTSGSRVARSRFVVAK